ncbi:formylglycine-generating enzyme required for sulfatase activity [Chitinophaga ginsengisoli]|uniref:Formylglycine-generating enzyme required for sulfatase activity n=2 Tax=Chitinophaga ginsengisoli TaxID=363837 RepID=A0A2P8G2D8_9BACT|nr:formylglycine-generating enzyme required for sulfatase activity [Chitinophaga ginsengisoli]
MLRTSIYFFALAFLGNGCSATDGTHKNMVWIKGGQYMMGSADKEGKADEYPLHKVRLSGFWIDATEVTNADFMKFVKATGYVTTAQKSENGQSTCPSGSYVFNEPMQPVSLRDNSAWWGWTEGADWLHPEGPKSTITGRENYPVVNVSWDDASAYARWAGKELPTEAQWEFAARGGLVNQSYTWGNEPVETGKPKTNTWQGNFPCHNNGWDGFKGLAPVGSFPPNAYGLYDMAGNVWEWCKDNYDANYYRSCADHLMRDPQGPSTSFDPYGIDPSVLEKVLRGGSFLCNAAVCKGYRVSSRMCASTVSRSEHTGFRCIAY